MTVSLHMVPACLMSLYARETAQLLQQETSDFISPDLCQPNSLDPNQIDYRIWGLMQERVYKKPLRDTSPT